MNNLFLYGFREGLGFQTTQWQDIFQARTENPTVRNQVLNRLIEQYWCPVYCYLRKQGYEHENAEDLTQGFFHEILLEKELVSKADPRRGRFRSFLLSCLQNFVSSSMRKQAAEKRTPRKGLIHCDPQDIENRLIHAETISPEDLFNYVWASQLVDNALAELERAYRSTDKTVYWLLFKERVLEPLFTNAPPSITELCQRYDLHDERSVSNMLTTTKRRFRGILLRLLEETLSHEVEVEEEYAELMAILARMHA